MGNNLLRVALGTGRTAKAVATGDHTCVLLDNNTVKCWVTTTSTARLGDTVNRGSATGQLGTAYLRGSRH